MAGPAVIHLEQAGSLAVFDTLIAPGVNRDRATGGAFGLVSPVKFATRVARTRSGTVAFRISRTPPKLERNHLTRAAGAAAFAVRPARPVPVAA
jgi:hypothetical protein